MNQQSLLPPSLEELFATRRTRRRFDPVRRIEPAMITHIIDLARQAPNTGDMQLYSVIATTDRQALAALAAEGHFNQPAARDAAAILTFCVDMRRFARWCALSGTRTSLDNLQGFLWAATDTAILAQQTVTIAEAMGLGTCYLGTTTYTADTIIRLLNLSQGVIPLTSVALGWPDLSDDEVKEPRLPLGEILHQETYRDTSDEELASDYRPTEQMPAARRFVSDNGQPSLAHLFTCVRYPRDDARAFSRKYLEIIRSAGVEI